MLNKGQKEALAVLNSGRNVFLSGEAGTGKSYLLNEYLNGKSKVMICAPTGIAAINVGGTTLHRAFKVPVKPIEPWKSIPKQENKTLDEATTIVIDEISMCRFDVFDYVIKCIQASEQRTGRKKQVIVVGDFFQLPPVMTDKDAEALEKTWDGIEIDGGYAFLGPRWKEMNFVNIVLTEVVRQKGDIDFVTNLNKLRKGDASAISWFNEHASIKKRGHRSKGVALCGTNSTAQEINEREIRALDTDSRTYRAEIDGDVKEADRPTYDVLTIKKGMRVISLLNHTDGDFQNGSVGEVVKFNSDTVTVRFENGISSEICSHAWEVCDFVFDEKSNEIKKVVVGSFRQIPLKPAYAITIHKSQGQTYETASVSPKCFVSGQLYVAISRVKSVKGLELERKITEKDLIVSQKVLDFYGGFENVTKQEAVSRGGTRQGSGRKKKYGAETKTIRVPVSAIPEIMKLLESREWD